MRVLLSIVLVVVATAALQWEDVNEMPCNSEFDCRSGRCGFRDCEESVACSGGLCLFENCIDPICHGGKCTFIGCTHAKCPGGACEFINPRSLIDHGVHCTGGRCTLHEESLGEEEQGMGGGEF